MKWLGMILLSVFAYTCIPNLPMDDLGTMQKNYVTEQKMADSLAPALRDPCLSNLQYCLDDAVRNSKIKSVEQGNCYDHKINNSFPSFVMWNPQTKVARFVGFDEGFRLAHSGWYTMRFCY